METITIKINKHTKTGKTFLELLRIFSKEEGVEIVEPNNQAKIPSERVQKTLRETDAGIGLKKAKNLDELFKALDS